MSQPPPPQPPNGGFGPPPEDQGAGTPPQPPSGQPGYGYPQEPTQVSPQPPGQPPQPPAAPPPTQVSPQPPGPPQQQPGQYGQQPGQYTPPSPYGQQQQPYGQPAYGYPQSEQPQYGSYPTPQPQVPGGYPPSPQRSGASGGKIALIVGVIVAVLLAAGGVTYVITKDDGGKDESKGKTGGSSQKKGGPGGGVDDSKAHKPASTTGKKIIDVAYPKIDIDVMSVDGQWATKKTYAKTDVYAIKGYDASGGSGKWTLPLSGEVCAASKWMTDDGKAAVIYKEDKVTKAQYKAHKNHPCSKIALFDVDSGKKVWDKTLPGGKDSYGSGMMLTISHNLVAAAWIGGNVAFQADSGKQLWATNEATECQDAGYGGGDNLIAVTGCPSPVEGPFQVQKVNQKTGKPDWSYHLPSGIKGVYVISTNPVVVAVSAGAYQTTDIFALTDDGKLRTKFSLDVKSTGPTYDPNCSGEVEDCNSAVVHGDTIYLPSAEHQDASSDYGRTNEIIAFSLDTGKPVKKFEAGEKRTMLPMKYEGGLVVGYIKPTYDAGGEIVAIDPKTGKKTTWLRLPNESAEEENSMYPERNPSLWAFGRLYLSQRLISDHGQPSYRLALGFGSE